MYTCERCLNILTVFMFMDSNGTFEIVAFLCKGRNSFVGFFFI